MGHYKFDYSRTDSYLFHRSDSFTQYVANRAYLSKYLRRAIVRVQTYHEVIDLRFHLDSKGRGNPGPYPPIFVADRNSIFTKTVLELEGLEYHWCSCPKKYHIIKVGSGIWCNNDISTVISDTDIAAPDYTSESGESDSSDESLVPN